MNPAKSPVAAAVHRQTVLTVAGALDDEIGVVVLDLSGVSVFDTDALDPLARVARICRGRSISLRVAPSATVQRVMAEHDLLHSFTIVGPAHPA
ncbi:STAS domain-containing protein [Pseudonocardia nigra]|uniref:STAS domain-containing protein n=1 Tax=Pseudonocardia nigra TaxID=1921578 RepID=UPI001C5F615A|nr:STAS domain-containing protein [Pseudonocardia nigra]